MENEQSRMESFQAKASDFLRRQGFFVVLGLCALCVAIAAAVRFLPKQEAEPTPPPSENVQQSDDERLHEVLALPTPEPATPSSAPVQATATPRPTAAPVRASSKGAPPVEGAIIWGFAMDQLLYSKTLEQWTTHDGVDIAAKLGTEVRVFLAGEVLDVYADSALGITVSVGHDGGLVSHYANLAKDPPVEPGQKINAGTVVGVVGNTATSECALEPHLHFSVYKQEKAVDPHEYILLP